MEGERDEPEKRGIVPNSFAHIFGHIAKCKGEVQYVNYNIIYINCIKRSVYRNISALILHCALYDFSPVLLYILDCDHCRFLVRVSYLELYNEEVRDLLSKSVHNRLEIRERADIGVYVKDLSKFSVKNPEDMDRLMAIGNKNSK